MEYSNYEDPNIYIHIYIFFLFNIFRFLFRRNTFASRKIKASEYMKECKQKRRKSTMSKVNVDAEKGETRGRGKKE